MTFHERTFQIIQENVTQSSMLNDTEVFCGPASDLPVYYMASLSTIRISIRADQLWMYPFMFFVRQVTHFL